ncbi:hypothetical protein P153DRAFT_370678 [Dothidotthia symphoricarpi CBS 119687]|uniref:C2H2-type domain-containing protein n=1 Tax=Dothidotthia symphoricarpi CBS 119687 TaxID=1392245 RepID=A0A6A6A0U0_9PLEO|nr:uncharacterized protein P153DRAFT_370678 [Dothidotthia symphoricarpi CBS 119687]KAF2124764.1 hypothetical protein P153DRAFT_370678 [Dothidotthia symphoricarpi CBS 119687]
MMEQRRLAPYTSSPPYQGMMEMSLSHESHHCDAHTSATPESCQGSFDEHTNFHSIPHGYAELPASREPEHSFEPWLMEIHPSASPVSTVHSSMSLPEATSTPYADTPLPLYHLLEQPLPHRPNSSTSHPTWMSSTEAAWQCYYAESDVWTTQQLPSPAWSGDSYGLPLPSMCNYFPPINDASLTAFSNPVHGQPYVESEAFHIPLPPTFEDAESPDVSTDTSDSESDVSEYEDGAAIDGRRKDSASSKQRSSRPRSPLVKVVKWDVHVDTYNQPEVRHYICPFSKDADINGRKCEQKFVRPEHLRRHVKTVHGNQKDYFCKVPNCTRAFSRGDNLRDHYWTHLARGGRAGKNDKMTLPELKAILGPKEKKLIRRLKHRLHVQKLKQWPPKSKL